MKKIIFTFLICFANIAFSQGIDTLSVYQNDTLIFERTDSWFHRPCSKHGEFSTQYELINPKEDTYYFIYNDKKQLVEEGMVSSKYFEGAEYRDFYNSKYYYYKDNGKLSRIYYQEDGQNVKTEYYKRGKLREAKNFTS